MATGFLFNVGSKGVKFTDKFYEALKTVKKQGASKLGLQNRAQIFNQIFSETADPAVYREFKKEFQKVFDISDRKYAGLINYQKRSGRLFGEAQENYRKASLKSMAEDPMRKERARENVKRAINQESVKKTNFTKYKKIENNLINLGKNLDETIPIKDQIIKAFGFDKNKNPSNNALKYMLDNQPGGWKLHREFMLADPALKNMALKIDEEIKFYNRNKKAYQMSEPSEELTIKPTGQKLEENIIFGKGRPSAVEVKRQLNQKKGTPVTGPDRETETRLFQSLFPNVTLSGEHTMMLPTKNKLERLVTDFSKKHGGFKEATYTTTLSRNLFKNSITERILTNNLKKSELLNNVIPGQMPGPQILDQIRKFNAAIKRDAKELEDLGLETAIFDSASNKGQGQIKFYGKRYDNLGQLYQSVGKGIVPQKSNFVGPPKQMPLKNVSPKKDGNKILTRNYQEGGSVFKNPFLRKIDEVFNPITNEPPAGVTDQPPEGGFLEPIAEGITETFTTPEGRLNIYNTLSLQGLEDKIEVIQRNREIDEITDQQVQNYLQSIDNAKNFEMQFKADMSNVTAGLDRDGNYMDSFNNPFLQQMMANGQRPTSLDVQQAYESFKNTDGYKDLTNTLFSDAPLKIEERKKVQSKLFANQLKTLPADVADVLVNTYQFLSPFAYMGEAGAGLENQTYAEYLAGQESGDPVYARRGYPLLEQIADDAGYDRPLDLFLPGGPLYDPDVKIDFAEIQQLVDENRIMAGEPTGGQKAGAAAMAGFAALPLFMGSGYFGRMIETAGRRDITKLGKFFKMVPQAAGLPSVKDAKAFFGSLWAGLKAVGTDKNVLKNIEGILVEMSGEKTQEKTEAYYEAKRNELENPQFLQQREMFKNQILKAYRGETTEQVVNPQDFDKMLDQQDENEKIPDYVREIAFEEAMSILKEEQFRLLGKEPPGVQTQPDESLFEEVTGVDLVPGENVRGMAMGGDPGQFTDPLRMPDDDAIDVRGIQEDVPYMSIDELDLFEEANLKPTLDNQMPEVQLASANIFGKLPGWAVYLDKKSDLLGSGKQTQNLIRIGDQVAEATKTPTENINRFYSNLEAKLLDPSVPDTFTTPEELFNFFQSRNIGKLEVEDYQLPQLFQSIFKSGQPVTKAQLLSRIKEAPIRKLKSQTFGFRSEIDNGDGQFIDYKYGDGHFESGANSGTYRESVIYLKPDDIPGDPAAYRHSVHNFFPADDAYVVGWSRLTDRPAIISGTGKQLSGDTTTKLLELEKKRDRLTTITNKSAQDIVDQSGGRVSLEQAQKNIDNAQKQLTKIQDDITNFGSGAKQAVVGDEVVNVTFADEIQSDIFQRYRKHLEQVKDEYQKIVSKLGEVKSRDPRFIRDELYSSDVNSLTVAYYAKHKDILRPVFRTEEDFVGHIKALQESNEVMRQFAQIRPGMLTEGAMVPVREAQKKRDDVLKFFDEIRVDPETIKQLFPNVPFKDRKAWGDVLVKNDLHMAAKRLFVDGDQNAPTWYAITPAKLVANRYSQAGTTATPLAQRAGKKGVGTYEFYGGPDATDVNGKHYTSILEQSLKRAANINNAEFKIIKVGISTPTRNKKVIEIVDMSGGQPTVVKTINVKKNQSRAAIEEATAYINKQPNADNLVTNTTSYPEGFETVDAYAIKLTPEMVLPSKTHMAIGGYVKYDPMPNIEEVIGAA